MKNFKINLLALSILLVATACTQRSDLSPTGRIVKPANTDWVFYYYPVRDRNIKAEIPPFAKPEFDVSAWKRVALPHTWSTYETTGELHPYIKSPGPADNPYWWNGIGVYRKVFKVDGKHKGRKFFAEFDGVQKVCRVYINEKYIGQHFGGYGGFYFDLSDYILYDGAENILCVEVSNVQDDPFKVPPTDAGNWNPYSGMTRSARFVITDPVFIPYQGSYKHEGGTFITSENVTEKSADVRVRTWVKNENKDRKTVQAKLVTVIRDAQNKEMMRMEESRNIHFMEIAAFDTRKTLNAPKLWSPDTPALYTAESQVWVDGKQVDVFNSRFGIRDFTWNYDEHRLYVNGKQVMLRGFNRHTEFPWLGDAYPAFINRMDMENMRYNLNCNFVRHAHYLSSDDVYDVCDEIGLITCGDQPNVKDKDFSLEVQEMMVREMVRRHRNHPSMLLWNMGDETNRSADSRWAFEEDQTRYISCRHCPYKAGTGNADIPGKYISLTNNEFGLAKLLRCTVRGWYDDDDNPNRPDNQQWAGNESFHHDVVRNPKYYDKGENRVDMPNVVIWLFVDHGCDREYKNSPLLHYNPKGWVDSYRVPKYVYYLFQANYAEKPMIFVHPHFWRSPYIGTNKKFTVNSNCEEVELFVGNKSYGRQKPNKEGQFVVDFDDVPVSDATSRTVGYRSGNAVAEHQLPMTGKPDALTLKSSHDQIEAQLNAVAIVTADIVDAKKNHIYGARNTLKWEVKGPAKLVGPGIYESDFSKSESLAGTLYIDVPVSNVIRSTGEPGDIVVMVSADGIKKAEVVIKAVTVRGQDDDF